MVIDGMFLASKCTLLTFGVWMSRDLFCINFGGEIIQLYSMNFDAVINQDSSRQNCGKNSKKLLGEFTVD